MIRRVTSRTLSGKRIFKLMVILMTSTVAVQFEGVKGAEAAPLPTLTVATIQFPIRAGATETSLLAEIDQYINDAREKKAQLVIFPELVTYALAKGGDLDQEAAKWAIVARDFTPKYFDHIRSRATETGMMILGGSSPRITPDGIVNTAILAFPKDPPIFQDKLFPTPDEVKWKWVGGKNLNVIDTAYGRIAILICYDSEFPHISHQLGKLGPELILIPSMTGEKGLTRVRWAAQARAVEHYAYIVVTGTVATDSESTSETGQSVFITPSDLEFPGILAQGPYNTPAMTIANLDLAKLRQNRASARIYPLRDSIRNLQPTVLENSRLTAPQK